MTLIDRRALLDTLGVQDFHRYEEVQRRTMELPDDLERDLEIDFVRVRERNTGPHYVRPRMRAATYEEHEAVSEAPDDLRWALETIRELCAELDRAADEAGWP